MKKSTIFIGIWALVVLAWLAIFFLIPKKNLWDTEIISCENSIKASIKSPYSAVFSDMKYKKWTSHFVVGVVDSENSFGAMMRSNFICVRNLNETNYRSFFDGEDDPQAKDIYDSWIKLSNYF